MADYIPFDPSELQPGSPGTSAHFQRWANNWEAGFEGAPGAPRLRRGALQGFGVGTMIFYRRDAAQSTNSATYVGVASFNFVQAGTIRVALEHNISIGITSTVQVVLTRAGVATVLQTWTSTSGGTYIARTLDVSVVHGDIISVQHAGPGSSTVNIRNIRYSNDGTAVWDTVGGRVE